MCWNEQVSFGTFLLATAMNAVSVTLVQEPVMYAAAAAFEWGALMQAFEGYWWLQVKAGKEISKASWMGGVAVNLLQPFVTVLVLFAIREASADFEMAAGVLISVFSVVLGYMVIYHMNFQAPYVNEEGHFGFPWWNSTPPWFKTFFMLTIAGCTTLLARPMMFGALMGAYIALTSVMAYFMFQRSTPSMWCWFAAFSPVFLLLFWHLSAQVPLIEAK